MLFLFLLLGCSTPSDPAPLPDAGAPAPTVIEPVVLTSETVRIEVTPEMERARRDRDAAKAEADRLEAAVAWGPGVAERAAAAGGLDALCATYAELEGWSATPELPTGFPETPAQTRLCGGTKRGDALWLSYLTTGTPEQQLLFWEDGLLAAGHTVEPWAEEDQTPSFRAFNYGNAQYGGAVQVDRSGEISVVIERY